MSSKANPDTFTSIHAPLRGGRLDEPPKLELPALYIHGEADPFPVDVSHNTFELIRGAELSVLGRNSPGWKTGRGSAGSSGASCS